MDNKEILENAPEGATHFLIWLGRIAYFLRDKDGEYLFKNTGDYEWQPLNCPIDEFTRSLDDLRAQLKLMERVAELEKEREIHNLEQQAKGVDDFVKWLKETDCNSSLEVDERELGLLLADQLRQKAQELKNG